MKKVSSRDFQLHAAKYLKELPIVLTSHNIPVATVIPYNDVKIGIDYGKEEATVAVLYKDGEVIREKKLEPQTYLGRPLSGRKATCTICLEADIPEEFAQKHYNEKHSDI